MRTTTRRLAGALLAFTMASLAATPTAGAIVGDGSDEPPEVPDTVSEPRPELTISDARIGESEAGWQVTYTVKNTGTAASGSFQVAVHKDGATLVGSKTESSIAANDVRNSVIPLSRSTCYIAVRLTADSTKVVTESAETNNVRWAVGQGEDVCGDAPKYKVQATKLTAVKQQNSNEPGTADEPYVVISRVGNSVSTGFTWQTPVYDNVVTGQTVSIAYADGCVWSRQCAATPAPYGIGFSVQVLEHDHGDLSRVRSTVADGFAKAGPIVSIFGGQDWAALASPYMADAVDSIIGWLSDDVIGSRTYAFTPLDLAQRVPLPGDTFEDTRFYNGAEGSADAVYKLTFKFTRVS